MPLSFTSSSFKFKLPTTIIRNKKSTQILKKITNNDMSFFCYPYGGKSTYNNSTKKILKKIGYKYSFIVDQKDSNVLNINFKPYELSRIDCNQFYEI